MKAARVLIADDHELVRRGLAAVLSSSPRWTIVAQADNGLDAVALARELKPDIAVLDLSMPGLNGLETTRQIRAATDTRILIVTAHDSEQLVREVLSAGAMGYILKSDAGSLLVNALESLLDNRPFFTSSVAQRVLDGYLTTTPAAQSSDGTLSPRERQIVQLLAEGNSNKDIARLLQLSVKTVETHRGNIMQKMGFASLADLVRYAIRNHIASP